MKRYEVHLTSKAEKQLRSLSKDARDRIVQRIEGLTDGMKGDVKRLKSFSPAYRLRVGDYRVLFDVDGSRIDISLIGNRRDVYDR